MVRTALAGISFVFQLFMFFSTGFSQNSTSYSHIPRVDVHAHIRNTELMGDYLEVSRILKNKHDINLEVWLNLNAPLEPDGNGIEYLNDIKDKYDGRFLPCINDYKISDGLRYSPENLVFWHKKGVAGYKIWVGVSPESDDPANDPTWTKMEQLGMVGASIHVSQPYPTKWCDNPVKFWQAQNAWERVLDRHPKLTVVMAHVQDFFYSDEQLDYLRYMLETYPNYNVDLAARFQQFHRIDRQNLRDFIIHYSDRILFGTDISKQPKNIGYDRTAEAYYRCFQLLETDTFVDGGFFGEQRTQGLALPVEVLANIYYKNAARIYPGVKDTLTGLGYSVE